MKDRSREMRCGYTLVEVMIASALSGLVMLGVLSAYSIVVRSVRAGTSQVMFNGEARLLSQKIAARIEEGKTVSVGAEGLDIVTIDLRCARFLIQDADGNSATVEDNSLVYDPDTAVVGDEVVYGWNVSAIAGEPVFSIVPATPSSARVCLHIGDGTNTSYESFAGTGAGYQGVEMRVSATPRNLQRWYD